MVKIHWRHRINLIFRNTRSISKLFKLSLSIFCKRNLKSVKMKGPDIFQGKMIAELDHLGVLKLSIEDIIHSFCSNKKGICPQHRTTILKARPTWESSCFNDLWLYTWKTTWVLFYFTATQLSNIGNMSTVLRQQLFIVCHIGPHEPTLTKITIVNYRLL